VVVPSFAGAGLVAWLDMSYRRVISDETWAIIEPLLPSTQGRGGGRYHDHRPIVEGIAYRFRTGCPWRDVPVEFGAWQTLWKRHNKWSGDGTWQRVLAALQGQADEAGELDWVVAVDSTVVRAHQHAAGARHHHHTGGGAELHNSAGAVAA
jgi:transposase